MIKSLQIRTQNQNYYLICGLCFSFLVHILLFFALNQKNELITQGQISIHVELAFEKKKQLVSLPQKLEEQNVDKNLETNLEAQQSSQVEKEQIKRGDPLAGQTSADKTISNQNNTQTHKKTHKSIPEITKPNNLQKATSKSLSENQNQKLSSFKLDQATLLNKFAQSNNSEKNYQTPENYTPFSRAAGSGASIIGLSGSNDFLPHLPDGDLTMLNAKANLFAVFVRRVATKVFAQLRQVGWEELRSMDLRNISDFCTVSAIMSLSGELISVKLESSSGSSRFDQVLISAVKNGAKDNNPPIKAALDDGNIHFTFKSRSWSQFGAARNGAPYERRWILLGTGLE